MYSIFHFSFLLSKQLKELRKAALRNFYKIQGLNILEKKAYFKHNFELMILKYF